MTGTADDGLAEAYLAHHFAFRPVDASFMGLEGYDQWLPNASAGAAAAERHGIADLRAQLAAASEPDSVGGRLDRRLIDAQLAVTETALDALPRFANPAWYTGEAAFGIISLLLPQARTIGADAVLARLRAIPDFLSDGQAHLAGQAAPRGLVDRARREAAASAAFLTGDLRLHPAWDGRWEAPAAAAAEAFAGFAETIADLPDRSVACGKPYLELLMREAHGLPFDAGEAVRRAEADYARLGEELVALAAQVNPDRSWQEQVEDLNDIVAPSADGVVDFCRDLDCRALADGAALVTPATDYGLDYRWLPECFRAIARDTYFLPYRSPPAGDAGEGSIYWVSPPGGNPGPFLRAYSQANSKVINAVHHGSIGHHSQNARARAAQSRLARIAGTDCALGLAFLSSGTMVEGWACYAQDLMQEAPGFYSPAEKVLLKQLERRNVSSVLVDIRLHTGEWSMAQAADFYEQAGFAPPRIEAELTRNGMLPASRLMYWLGIEQIRDLRKAWRGDARGFHDTLIGYGHVPVAWAGEEMARAGLIA